MIFARSPNLRCQSPASVSVNATVRQNSVPIFAQQRRQGGLRTVRIVSPARQPAVPPPLRKPVLWRDVRDANPHRPRLNSDPTGTIFPFEQFRTDLKGSVGQTPGRKAAVGTMFHGPGGCLDKTSMSGARAELENAHIVAHNDNVMFGPGDILVARSNNTSVMQIGAIGGYFGHVMLVIAPARCIPAGSVEARQLAEVWPHKTNVKQLWAVTILESTRQNAAEGLRDATLLLHVERPSGNIIIVGDLSSDDELSDCDGTSVEVLRSPMKFRSLAKSCPSRLAAMREVVEEMKADMSQLSWSQATAVRAALMPAGLDRNSKGEEVLAQICESWGTEPICTSVAIIFWQRFFCKLAALIHGDESLPDRSLAWIHRWMPIWADRSLPGEMCDALVNAGWIKEVCLNTVEL